MISRQDGSILYANIKEKMIYKAEIKNRKVFHTSLFNFFTLASRYSFKFYVNLSRTLVAVKDSSNSFFGIIHDSKSREISFRHDITDIQLTEKHCYVFLEDKNKFRPLVQVFDSSFRFITEFTPNWSSGTLVKAYTLNFQEYFFKIEEDMRGGTCLKIYHLTPGYRCIRKRRFRFGNHKMFVRDLFLAKELEDKYIFLYHVDDQIMVFKCFKNTFYVEKISDSLKVPLADSIMISNGVWAWGKNYLSYISPVYELFD